MNNNQDPLAVTDEELAAIDYYINYGHAQINMLCNLKASNYFEMAKGRYFPKTKQEFLKMIERFVDIYSLTLKLDEPRKPRTVYRGSSNHEYSRVPKNAFISTSKKHFTATSFLSYSDSAALSTFSIPDDLPVLDIELLKHHYSDKLHSNLDEDEILILPFAHVTRSIGVKDKKADRTNYNITLAKTNLEPISQEELSQLQTEIADSCEQYLIDLKQEAQDADEIEGYSEALSHYSTNLSNPDNMEKYTDFSKRKEELVKKCSELGTSNDEFRQKLIKLVRGLCAQRELEINQAKEARAKRMAELRQEIEAQKAQRLNQEANAALRERYQNLIQAFRSTPSQIEQLTQSTRQLASDIEAQANHLGMLVNTDDIRGLNEFFNRMQTTLPVIQNGLQKASSFEDKETDQANFEIKALGEEQQTLNILKQSSDSIRLLEPTLRAEADNSIKRKLYIDVFEKLKDARISSYQQQIIALQSERPGLFDGFTGKSALREEQIRQLQLKQEYERSTMPAELSKYSIRDILGSIYFTFDVELQQAPPPDIQNTIDRINSAYRRKIHRFSRE